MNGVPYTHVWRFELNQILHKQSRHSDSCIGPLSDTKEKRRSNCLFERGIPIFNEVCPLIGKRVAQVTGSKH